MPLSISRWQESSVAPVLSAGQVHLWRISLDPSRHRQDLKHLLSHDELARAARLIDADKRQQSILTRGRLRQILASYLHNDPAVVEFCYGRYGKPALSNVLDQEIFFNLSHSGRWMLLAITQAGDVGIDVEKIDSQLDYLKLAAQFFTAEELNQLKGQGRQWQRREFYRLWTSKEAKLKTLGGGFSAPAQALLSPSGWQNRTLPVASGYLATLVCPVEITSIVRLQLVDS